MHRMQRIAVIGCGGSGKTRLANRIGSTLQLPVVHIDGFYWRDIAGVGRVESTPDEWAATHRALIAATSWVLDGMKLQTLAARLEAVDRVIFLDLPTWSCVWGVLSRRIHSHTSVRPDLGTFDVGISREFLAWIVSFRRKHRPRILSLLASCSCDVVVLRSRADVRRFEASLPSMPHRLAA